MVVGSLWFGLISVVVFALLQLYKSGRSIFD